MFRFIHTSDLHLGKRFGQFPEELRGRLTEARHQSINSLASLAQSHNASAILVAGDIFDTGTPSPSIIRQALQVMGDNPSVNWMLLPGNHDSLASDELWKQVEKYKPENVIPALESTPIEIASSVFILPAPCINKRVGRDLTEWMNQSETPADAIRIGLAHGPIQGFGDKEDAPDIINPNRAKNADLDYLALGDWHGKMQVTKNVWYSGAPEPDRFKHNMPGQALIVSIDNKGAQPVVTAAETGRYNWQISNISILPGDDLNQKLADELPEVSKRRDSLQQFNLEGRIRLPERLKLEETLKELEPDFAWMETRSELLGNVYDVVDLDSIDHAGALRKAAEKLFEKVQQDDDPNGASATALSLLYSFAAEDL